MKLRSGTVAGRSRTEPDVADAKWHRVRAQPEASSTVPVVGDGDVLLVAESQRSPQQSRHRCRGGSTAPGGCRVSAALARCDSVSRTVGDR